MRMLKDIKFKKSKIMFEIVNLMFVYYKLNCNILFWFVWFEVKFEYCVIFMKRNIKVLLYIKIEW